MKKLLLSFICLTVVFEVFPQGTEGPTTAPKINPFSLGGDNLGAAANSVNLFTGDLSLPLNLVSIQGNGGLGIDVTIAYSSANIENVADIRNEESATGVLGLGWSFGYPMIVADNKLTGTREDDEFYLLEGGVSTKLICTGNSSGIKNYKTKSYTNWVISFTASNEKWEITNEDGSKYVYGDQASGRNTVQWIVKWDNWIGNSNIFSSQRQGIAWNLSEIKNTWGEKITYTYTNEEYFVGKGATNYTQASYLAKITDTWGREVELVYKNKLTDEYFDPNTEFAEPDAYQERYERKYLDKIIVRVDGLVYHEILLQYVTNLLGSGNLTKRLLKSILKITPNGNQSPPTQFDYITSPLTAPMRGALNKIILPTGGTVKFDYSPTGIEINHSTRDLPISAPPGYAEPRVFIENDFAVVTWRQLNGSAHDKDGQRPVHVFAYSWEGKWRESNLGTIGNTKLIDNTAANFTHDFQLVTGKDFFAALRPVYGSNIYWIYLWHKDERTPGAWIGSNYTVDLGVHDNTKEELFAADNFIAVTNNKGKIVRYVWSGGVWSATTTTEPANTHFTTVANNYIISHDTGPNPDVITMYYLDETETWQTQTVGTTTFNNGSSDSKWYGSNSFAFVMANGNNEFIYKWNESYTGFQRIDKSLLYSDQSAVNIINNSQINIIENGTQDKIRALRFNGYDWIVSPEITGPYAWDSSFGDEYLLWSGVAASQEYLYLRKFNINTSTWDATDTAYPKYPGRPTSARAGLNYFYSTEQLYRRNQNDTWSIAPFSLTRPDVDYLFGDKYIAPGFVAYRVFKAGQPNNNKFLFLKNGLAPAAYDYEEPNFTPFMQEPSKNISRLNPFCVVVGAETGALFQDRTSLSIWRMLRYNMKGKLKDYPVIRVTRDDGVAGTTDNFTSFDYSASTATMDPSGSSANYNLVTTIPGSDNVNIKPYGYTQTYFFNRLPDTETGNTFPSGGNAASYYLTLTGNPYRVKVFNSSSNVVSETNTVWNVEQLYIANSTGNVEGRFFQAPQKIINVTNGIETQTQFGYHGTYKQQNFIRTVTKNVNGEKEVVDHELTFAWQVYPAYVSKNILSPVVQTKKDINGSTYVESSVTRYKDWPCSGPNCIYATVPAPVDQYAWKGTNSSNFTWWDVATQTPVADWLFLGKTLTRDNSTGAESEFQGQGNQVSCVLLNQNKRNVIASISNAPLSKIAYTSFEVLENVSTGNWSSWEAITPTTGNSKTGDRYLSLGTTGLTKSGLISTDRYTVSFWAKASNGSVVISGVGTVNLGNLSTWTLFEYTITNLTSFNIKKSAGTVDIDEIRLHPVMARMNTATFHPMFGATSSTSPNNQSIYTDYDELGRVKNKLDQKQHIIQTFLYNFKKQ